VVGEAMEVQGCGEQCDFCGLCEWEACTILADHGETWDVQVTSDGQVCEGVKRRHLRPAARAAAKRAAAAAGREAAPSKQARAPHLAAPSRPAKRKAGRQ